MKRNKFKLIEKTMNDYIIPLIFGFRRIGKTKILEQIMEKYNSSKVKYISWDEPIYAQNMNDSEFFDYLKNLSLENDILLFDEVQDSNKEWDRIIKVLYDQVVSKKICKIIVTGSSSLLLQASDLGVNRVKRIFLDTWSFDEYSKLLKTKKTIANFEIFLGKGFPDLAKEKDINFNDAITNILNPIIKEDIRNLYKEIDIYKLTSTLYKIATKTNGEINEQKLSKDLGFSLNSIRKYIRILEECNIIKKVYRLNYTKERKVKKMKRDRYKIYINPHIHILLLQKHFYDLENKFKGHIIEAYYIFNKMSNGYYHERFYYLKDNNNKEIDLIFLNTDETIKEAIEFKYSSTLGLSDFNLLLKIKSDKKTIYAKKENKDFEIQNLSIIDFK